MDRLAKRRRMGVDAQDEPNDNADQSGRLALRSLTHPISPPRKKGRQAEPPSLPAQQPEVVLDGQLFNSPFQLTKIRDLPPAANVETVTLRDILGDPLIAECWEFNYLHDIDFLMNALDEDVRQLIKVHVVHGSWKREDPNRLGLQEQASRYKNVELHVAFMPEPFGTHHSKMIILLRHDDMAQVIIHTANMIARDWTNMTQGIWRSPLLPLLKTDHPDTTGPPTVGSGEKFKIDLLGYLRAYDTKRIICGGLADQLTKFDFSAIRGSLIASVPGRHAINDGSLTQWGWVAVKQVLGSVPIQEGKSDVVVQLSSIATLGPTDTWLKGTLFNSLSQGKNSTKSEPEFKVVFPTADEIRRSLDGYASGGSIHTKIQSQQQQKQLQYLKPIFHHWSNDAPDGTKRRDDDPANEAGRKRAAPHIKTYIRTGGKGIDWALLTSANLSKQAWGGAVNASSGEVRIASWEIGVMVWPSLFAENARMKATYHTDTPSRDGTADDITIVGLRVPYDSPLQRYGPSEKPWVATSSHSEPDWRGQTWSHT